MIIDLSKTHHSALGEFEGQTVLGQHGPSPFPCFGSNERGFEPFVTAETGGMAWPMVH